MGASKSFIGVKFWWSQVLFDPREIIGVPPNFKKEVIGAKKGLLKRVLNFGGIVFSLTQGGGLLRRRGVLRI